MNEWGDMIPTYSAGMKRCPVCRHRDNCSTWKYNHNAIFCRRVTSEHPGSGGWTHILDGEAPRPVLRLVKPEPKPAPVDRRLRDLIYRALLQLLVLLPAHRDDLLQRGLSLQAIEHGLFKSTPTKEEAVRIVKLLCEAFDLSGVPGFYKERGEWCLMKTPSGFTIPVLDRDGLIQGLQIRKDYQRDKDDPRYIWLSTNPEKWKHGTKLGAPIHIQSPELIVATGRAIITEGALKAFIASHFLSPEEGGLIALAGTSAFRENFGAQLLQAWPNLRNVVIAFDADWRAKREVKASLYRLIQSLKCAGLNPTLYTWEHGKGLDDFLVAESCKVAEVA